jgi:YD repeat-containing protein
MARVESIWWDDEGGRDEHISEHDVTKDEVEEVLLNPVNPTTTSRASGEQITFGYTSSGRYLAVVWAQVLEDPFTVYPITAYDAPEPGESKSKSRGKRKR